MENTDHIIPKLVYMGLTSEEKEIAQRLMLVGDVESAKGVGAIQGVMVDMLVGKFALKFPIFDEAALKQGRDEALTEEEQECLDAVDAERMRIVADFDRCG